MLENQHILDQPTPCKTCDKSIRWSKMHKAYHRRSQEAYYLRYITKNLEFYRKQLNELPISNVNDKLICRHIREVVQTFKTTKVKKNKYV